MCKAAATAAPPSMPESESAAGKQAGRQASDQEPEPYNLRGHKFRETCVQFADGYSLSFNDNNLSAVHEFMWPLLQALQLNAVAQ